MNILENYLLVKNKIKHAAEECNRKDSEINLIAVSKSFSEQKIKILLEAGHREFGENRVQEANSKWLELKKSYDKIVLHLIGPLQTNKVRLAL